MLEKKSNFCVGAISTHAIVIGHVCNLIFWPAGETVYTRAKVGLHHKRDSKSAVYKLRDTCLLFIKYILYGSKKM